MKRLIAIIFALMFLLCGCEVPNEERDKDYPKLEYQNSQWEYDSKDMYIPIPEGYVLNQGHAYEIVKTEDGYDIILHMIKEE